LRRAAHGELDPAYALPEGVTFDVAVRWGPHLLRRRDPLLREQLDREIERLEGAARHGRPSILRDLTLARQASAWWAQP
jgi:tRNA (adenine22-N1)-methyltransferase